MNEKKMKTIENLDASTKITKSVSHGLELANQALDKEIEIEIDVDKVVSATKTIANKTIEHSKVPKKLMVWIIFKKIIQKWPWDFRQ